MFYGYFCAHRRLNEAKSKMKHRSDMPMLRFEDGGIVICGPTPYRYTTEALSFYKGALFARNTVNAQLTESQRYDKYRF